MGDALSPQKGRQHAGRLTISPSLVKNCLPVYLASRELPGNLLMRYRGGGRNCLPGFSHPINRLSSLNAIPPIRRARTISVKEIARDRFHPNSEASTRMTEMQGI